MPEAEWSDREHEPLTEEDIAAYLDGFEEARAKTLRHIEKCSYCRDFIRLLESLPRPQQLERMKFWRCSHD
ncbi:MAG TPA: hypothetical protein VGF59_05560 [Bryobacteraceae bacterium]|jgi:hypothetical protein